MYLFIHIPKSAGTTFNDILKRNFNEGYISLYGSKKTRFFDASELTAIATFFSEAQVVASHHFTCPLTLPQSVDVTFKPITFLRDPVDRVLSTYFYQKKQVGKGIRKEFTDLPLEEYFERVKEKGYRDSGGKWSYLCNMQAYVMDRDYDISRAKKRMSEDFLLAGVSERFDESLLILKKRFKTEGIAFKINYVEKNKGRKLDAGKYLPEQTYKKILEVNLMDKELHDFANQLLDEEIRKYGATFHADLENFRRQQKRWRLVAGSAGVFGKILEFQNRLLNKLWTKI